MNQYHQRFNRVIQYLEAHLEQPLNLDRLCELAHFSKFHFHRQFSAYLGMNPKQYIQQLRLKRAAHQLAYRCQLTVTEIAYQAAFTNSESFSRAFKRAFGQTPSAYRRTPTVLTLANSLVSDNLMINQGINMPTLNTDLEVTIVELPEIKLAVYQHLGCPSGVMKSVQHFITWRRAHHTPPSESATYNLVYDDPSSTPPEHYRFDICAQTLDDIAENDFNIVNKTIPAGQYAKLRHFGSEQLLPQSFDKLYGQWLPNSGRSLTDFPCILQRIKMYPDVPESQAVIDILLPLA